MEKLEQAIRLIRSKGIGIYFITQSPSDIPETILAQLGNRIQHALRAYTPNEQKAIKVAAQTFRSNPAFDTTEAITVLGTGEALVSFLDNEGSPTMVQRGCILPPQSFMGPCEEEHRKNIINSSDLYLKYKDAVDNRSAYEGLAELEAEEEAAELKAQQEAEATKEAAKKAKEEEKEKAREERERERERQRHANTISKIATSTVRSTLGQIGRDVSRNLVRGLFGNLKR